MISIFRPYCKWPNNRNIVKNKGVMHEYSLTLLVYRIAATTPSTASFLNVCRVTSILSEYSSKLISVDHLPQYTTTVFHKVVLWWNWSLFACTEIKWMIIPNKNWKSNHSQYYFSFLSVLKNVWINLLWTESTDHWIE